MDNENGAVDETNFINVLRAQAQAEGNSAASSLTGSYNYDYKTSMEATMQLIH